jgi:hypothetical protein
LKRKVFVQLPYNDPSGGIKVGNQIVNLFNEHGYDSYVVLPGEPYQANWLIKPAPVINIARMMELCGKDDIIIDNWPDRETTEVAMSLTARTKVFYFQGCTFFRSKNLIGDDYFKRDVGYTHFWINTNDVLEYLKKRYPEAIYPPIEKWYVVTPYLEFESSREITQRTNRTNGILAFARKGRSYIEIARLVYGNRINFHIVNSIFTESEAYELYASYKFFLSTVVRVPDQHLLNIARFLRYGTTERNLLVISPPAHRIGSSLVPAEAAMCGSIVVGFVTGGESEWMSPSTCFMAKPESYSSLLMKIREALAAPEEQLNTMKENAFRAVSKLNKESTWQQIEAFLNTLSD